MVGAINFFLVKVKGLKKAESIRHNFLHFIEIEERGFCHRLQANCDRIFSQHKRMDAFSLPFPVLRGNK